MQKLLLIFVIVFSSFSSCFGQKTYNESEFLQKMAIEYVEDSSAQVLVETIPLVAGSKIPKNILDSLYLYEKDMRGLDLEVLTLQHYREECELYNLSAQKIDELIMKKQQDSIINSKPELIIDPTGFLTIKNGKVDIIAYPLLKFEYLYLPSYVEANAKKSFQDFKSLGMVYDYTKDVEIMGVLIDEFFYIAYCYDNKEIHYKLSSKGIVEKKLVD